MKNELGYVVWLGEEDYVLYLCCQGGFIDGIACIDACADACADCMH